MKLFVVVYKTEHAKEWALDGVYQDRAIADAKMHYETLRYPQWKHALAVAEVPDDEAVSA